MIPADTHNYLEIVRDDTIILEPRETHNEAIIGYEPASNRLVYSLSSLVQIHIKEGATEEEEDYPDE